MILNTKQEAGLREVIERYNNNEMYSCIAGFAGTGKSTLVAFIIDAIGLDREEEVCYAAYTGKAANVLKRKGCPNASTIHRLIYNAIPRKDGTFYFKVKERLDKPYKLIVIDEVSMVPEHMWETLLGYGIHILALGDPGQLPPVKALDNGILEHPHVFLDEVMRQEDTSDILRLSMEVRDKKPLKYFKGNDVRVISWDEYRNNMGVLGWADQIICAKNATRIGLNAQMRYDLFGWEDPLPQDGDKIICTRNNWNIANFYGDSLINGVTGVISDIEYKNRENFCYTPTMFANFIPDYYDLNNEREKIWGTFCHVRMDRKLFIEGEPLVNRNNFSRIPSQLKPNEFDFGYAITCHKAQGSEFEKVIVFEEYLKGDNADSHARWLYTAITRASKKLVIIKA